MWVTALITDDPTAVLGLKVSVMVSVPKSPNVDFVLPHQRRHVGREIWRQNVTIIFRRDATAVWGKMGNHYGLSIERLREFLS